MAQATTWIRPDARQPEWDLTVVRPDAATAADPSFGDLAEADLVAACLRGQNGAFDVIVERHRRAVYQLCYRFVGNHEDASDLSQDVFLRAYRGLAKLRGAILAGDLAVPDCRERLLEPGRRQEAAERADRRAAARRYADRVAVRAPDRRRA